MNLGGVDEPHVWGAAAGEAFFERPSSIPPPALWSCARLRRPEEIGQVFAGFQKYLYQQNEAA